MELLRVFFTVFGPAHSFHALALDWALMPLTLVAIFSMSLVPTFHDRLRRTLAYSGIAQIGYMILGISLVSFTALTAGSLHLNNHALIKGGLRQAMGRVVYRLGARRLDEIHGRGRTMPWTLAAFIAGGNNPIGMPGTTGFGSKWYLILGAVERGWWPAAVSVVIASLMVVAWIWRVVEVAYFTAPEPESEPIREGPASVLVPTKMPLLVNFYFGINAALTVGAAERAALQLLGSAPWRATFWFSWRR